MRHKYGSALMRRRARSGLLFISPWVVGAIAFFLIPLVKTVIYSFGEVEFDANGYYYAFSGSDKYHTMFFENADYLPMLWGSVKDLLLTVPVVLVFSFFVALLLKQKFRGNAVMKAIFFLPVIMSSGAFLTMQSGLSQINSAVDSSMAEVTQTVSVLSSVNLEKYLLEMGLSEKLIGYITAPIDNIYSVAAETSAVKAKNSEDASKASALASKESELAASQSETGAATSAHEASDSKDAAKQSELAGHPDLHFPCRAQRHLALAV